MKQLFLVFFAFALLFISCVNNEDELKTKVLKIKDMSELGTVEYTVTKIIYSSDDQIWYKFGGRKILFSCEAKLKAGVDLSKLTEDDIKVEKNKVTLKLPKAKLIYMNMDPEKINEEFSSVSVFRSSFTNAQKDAILVQGEKMIKESIPEMGILDAAEKNTTILLTSWLRQCNVETVIITYDSTTVKQ